MQPGFKQRFIRINVPYPGQHALIQKNRFQASACAFQAASPVARLQIKRFRSQAGIVEETNYPRLARKNRGAAKPADVAEAELHGFAIEIYDHMSVRHRGLLGPNNGQLTGHS